MSWLDSAGNLWLFGGTGLDKDGNSGFLNDLWKYDPATGNWTWVKGSDVHGQTGVYGEVGVEDAANTPGARHHPVGWVDTDGMLWLFSGEGLCESSQGLLNDLWKYDPATNNWTWMKGSKVTNQSGTYGTQGSADESNTPGARRRAVSWADETGALWLFGGFGLDKLPPPNSGRLNDLWKYDTGTGNWTWVKGSDEHSHSGSYGTRGVSDPLNTPGARKGAVSWIDMHGTLWLFGGTGYDKDSHDPGSLNDLWQGGGFLRAEILSPARSGTIVAGDTLRFAGAELNISGPQYLWDFNDGRNSSARNPGLVSFPATGTFTVAYSVTGAGVEAVPDNREYTVVENTGDIPDLRVTAVHLPAEVESGLPFDISYTVRNNGDGPIEDGTSWRDAVYLSANPHLGVDDILIASDERSGGLDPNESYENIITATLPAVEDGAYYLIIVANDQWDLIELHRLNNEYAAQINTGLPLLEKDDPFHAHYSAGKVEQYFRMPIDSGGNLLLEYFNSDPGLEIFVRYGSLPTRGIYDYRLDGDQLVIPAAAAGNWYILVYGEMSQDGSYSLEFNMFELVLSSSAPSRHGTETALELALTGAGFFQPLIVELVSGDVVIEADSVDVDSFARVTATFEAGNLPAGTYTVKVVRGSASAQIAAALEIIAGGEGKFEANLILPSDVGYNALATIYVEYANTGDAGCACKKSIFWQIKINGQ